MTQRITAQIRVNDALLASDDLMPEIEARLHAMLHRWERLGFGISDLRMDTWPDPATCTTLVALSGIARLDGRPTEVEVQALADCAVRPGYYEWREPYPSVTSPWPGGLRPTGPRTDGR